MDPPPLTLETLDPVLRQVLSEHQDKTLAWVRREPGAWGYLAGQGVTAARRHFGAAAHRPGAADGLEPLVVVAGAA